MNYWKFELFNRLKSFSFVYIIDIQDSRWQASLIILIEFQYIRISFHSSIHISLVPPPSSAYNHQDH